MQATLTNESNGGGGAAPDWHTLPPWFERFQDRFVLSLLIIAGMVLNGLFFAHGIVPDVERPFWEWGIFHIVLFVTFFAAGTGITGVTLRASAAIGRSFRRGWEGVLPGVIYTVIAFGLFFPLEVWASVTIRSVTALQTPADKWLLDVIGHPELPISPTVIAVALAAPLTVLVWGLVTAPPAEEDHAAQLARVRARQEAKLIKTEFGARRNQARLEGWAAAAKGAAKELGMGAEGAEGGESAPGGDRSNVRTRGEPSPSGRVALVPASTGGRRTVTQLAALEPVWEQLSQEFYEGMPLAKAMNVGGKRLQRHLISKLGAEDAPGYSKAQELAVRFRPAMLKLAAPRAAAMGGV